MDSHIRFSTLITKIKNDERRSFGETPIPLNNICKCKQKTKKKDEKRTDFFLICPFFFANIFRSYLSLRVQKSILKIGKSLTYWSNQGLLCLYPYQDWETSTNETFSACPACISQHLHYTLTNQKRLLHMSLSSW